MGVNRRQFLLGGLGLAAAATTMGLTGCAPGSERERRRRRRRRRHGRSAVRLVGQRRSEQEHQAAIDAYTDGEPEREDLSAARVSSPATGTSWPPRPPVTRRRTSSRWTWPTSPSTATGGALLDLSKVRHLEVRRGHRRLGQDQRQAGRHQRRHQLPLVFANPKHLREGGMDLPDDTTWTWDSLIETSAEVAAKAEA